MSFALLVDFLLFSWYPMLDASKLALRTPLEAPHVVVLVQASKDVTLRITKVWSSHCRFNDIHLNGVVQPIDMILKPGCVASRRLKPGISF